MGGVADERSLKDFQLLLAVSSLTAVWPQWLEKDVSRDFKSAYLTWNVFV